jgi:hypothetical protein
MIDPAAMSLTLQVLGIIMFFLSHSVMWTGPRTESRLRVISYLFFFAGIGFANWVLINGLL